MALDQTRMNEVLSYLHGGGAPPTTTAPRLRLYTAVGNPTTEGTQVATGGGYTGGNTTTSGVPLSWAAASGGTQATSAVAQVTNYPRAETVAAVEIWSSDATPRRIEYGSLSTPRTMAAGDTLSFAAGAITSSLT
jgi:hypothetical protein